MGYKRENGSFLSSNGVDEIAYYIYTPDVEPIGIIQISHGMCEYIKRYDGFISFFTAQGFAVCGNDHLGHGNSVKNDEELGYFAEKDGYKFLSEDLYKLTQIMRNIYKTKTYFLLGHSMGSFVARDYLTKYADNLDGAIIIGTSNDNFLSGLAIKAAVYASNKSGEKFRSEKINNLAFGKYNDKISNKRTDFDWLTRDSVVVDAYVNDKKCNFIFTNSGFHDLFSLLNDVTSKTWAEKIPTNLPILLMSGKDDPVGGYGKGVEKVYGALKDACVEDITMKIYDECRHEILNELNKKDVYHDILEWVIQKSGRK